MSLVELEELRNEHALVERNRLRCAALDRPIRSMLMDGSYTIDEQEQGQDGGGIVTFRNAFVKVELTVKEVTWLKGKPARPIGPTEMDPERERRLHELEAIDRARWSQTVHLRDGNAMWTDAKKDDN